MSLREIIYLDRDRIESYISQLAGGLTVQESAEATEDQKILGGIKAGIKVVDFESVAEKSTSDTTSSMRVPAHAILSTLEDLLQRKSLVADATCGAVVPGQIARLRGDATFESWGLLASLADSIQGIATLSAKIYGVTRAADDLKVLRARLSEIEKVTRQQGAASTEGTRKALGREITTRSAMLEVIDGKYIEDVKEVIRLFFQDQNQFRIAAPGGPAFVGLLRREHLVGSSMEEILFNYGSKPQVSFEALFYVAELGRADTFNLEDVAKRFPNMEGRQFSFGLLQTLIREVGSVLLELAEELRRPVAEETAFMVPLAIYREIRQPT